MYEPRHPITADAAMAVEHLPPAQPIDEDPDAYFVPQGATAPASLARALSPLEQMYAYYDEA